MLGSLRLRTICSSVLTALLISMPVASTSHGAQQNTNNGQGQENRSDPCTHLPDPPGNANGIDKQCPAFGSSNGVAKGDFNGDGVADLAIGVPGAIIGGKANVGLVQVIYGSGGGLTTNTTGIPKPQTFTQFDLSVLFLPAQQAGDRFGAALASGDFNHDGYSDLAIGIPGKVISGTFLATPDSMGAVVVVYGSANGLNLSAEADEYDITTEYDHDELPPLPPLASYDFSKAQFGASLAWGDFNNDGTSDLVVGAPGLTISYALGLNTASSTGGIWQLLGQPGVGLNQLLGMKLWTQNSIDGNLNEISGDQFGSSLAAGDFNGDGYSDIAVGVPYKEIGSATDAGMVVTLFGSFNVGLDPVLGGFGTVHLGSSAATGDHFGAALAAGDFDHNNVSDLAIGAPHRAIGPVGAAGVVFVVQDGGFQENLKPTISFNQNQLGYTAEAGDQFGTALAANDFNGDGYADLAVGVPFEDVIVNGTSVVDSGEVDVIYGSGSGLSTATHPPQVWTESVPTQGDRFGAPLTAWNFGRNELTGVPPLLILHTAADLAVGIPFATVNGASGAGAINVIYGSFVSNGLVSTNRQILTELTFGHTPQAAAHFGAAMY